MNAECGLRIEELKTKPSRETALERGLIHANGFGKKCILILANVLLTPVVLAAVLSSCAHTKFLHTWRDPAYTGQPKKILVHSVGRSPTVRTMFENQLVEQLKAHGVAALAGHEFLPDTMVVNREAIRQLVKEKGMDAVFIAGPTNRKDLESLRPGELSYAAAVYEGTVQDYDSFTAFVNGVVYSAGTYAGEEVFMEMVLFDGSSNRPIWSALSRTHVWDTGVDEIKPAVDRVVELLADEKVIP